MFKNRALNGALQFLNFQSFKSSKSDWHFREINYKKFGKISDEILQFAAKQKKKSFNF